MKNTKNKENKLKINEKNKENIRTGILASEKTAHCIRVLFEVTENVFYTTNCSLDTDTQPNLIARSFLSASCVKNNGRARPKSMLLDKRPGHHLTKNATFS